jgi:hypothetical protein
VREVDKESKRGEEVKDVKVDIFYISPNVIFY